jgi:UDP-N-acetylglucosamine 4,6-dehydratase
MNLSEHGHQKILITGITGTLGRAVCRRLLEDCGPNVSIMGISRCEQKQRFMPRDRRLTLRLGDVTDYRSLTQATEAWEGHHFNQIYHFAAYKCVDTLELQPHAAHRSIVGGTENMIRLAKETFARLIHVSTDKAAYPINAYGTAKAMAEKLVLAHEDFTVVRYGNVIGSRMSYFHDLVEALKAKRPAPVTDYKMTRFWWTVEDARDFVISSGYGERYGLQIPHWIRSSAILDFIEATAEVLGVKIYEIGKPIGKRPGEKYHECMATEYETEQNGVLGRGVFSNQDDRIMSRKELKTLIERALKGLQ